MSVSCNPPVIDPTKPVAAVKLAPAKATSKFPIAMSNLFSLNAVQSAISLEFVQLFWMSLHRIAWLTYISTKP